MDDSDSRALFLVALAAGLAGALWYFWDDLLALPEEPIIAQPELIVEEVPTETGPLHPIEPSVSTSPERNLVPLPPLDDSDSYFLLSLIEIFGPDVGHVLVSEALIDNFVATIDNLTRSHVAEKIRPVGRLTKSFVADIADSKGAYYLNPESYERFNLLVSLVVTADPEVVTETYRRYYPLFQESYQRLGYPNAYFNDRVVEVIDHLLLTPEPDDPIRLVRPHVLYEFADAELEALSSGQKLLLRMGSEHTQEIKQVLREFRELIAK